MGRSSQHVKWDTHVYNKYVICVFRCPSGVLHIMEWGMNHYPVFHLMQTCEKVEQRQIPWQQSPNGLDMRPIAIGMLPFFATSPHFFLPGGQDSKLRDHGQRGFV